QQGVAIGIFVKEPGKDGLARVFHSELWGIRKSKDGRSGKYPYLSSNDVYKTAWTEIFPEKPMYLFKPEEKKLRLEYYSSWLITDIMPLNSVGIVTARDKLTIHLSKRELIKTIKDFSSIPDETAREKFGLGKDSKDWKISLAKADLKKDKLCGKNISELLYRPFDLRYTYYTGNSSGFHCRPRPEVMRHMLAGDNLGICTVRNKEISGHFEHVFCTKNLIQHHTVSLKEVNYLFPLYIYKEPKNEINGQNNLELKYDELKNRYPNLNPDFLKEIEQKLKISFIQYGNGDLKQTLGPEDIFNFIYAVFHSATYRKRYAEFLKIDFPRVPVTSNMKLFRELASKGDQLVKLHLLESTLLKNTAVAYPVRRKEEEDIVEKGYPKFLAPGEPEPGTGKPVTKGRVYI
ncbi:unnamed protein product, partial [marine sediment metagenome]